MAVYIYLADTLTDCLVAGVAARVLEDQLRDMDGAAELAAVQRAEFYKLLDVAKAALRTDEPRGT